ncbi:MAG: L-lactate permease [Bacillota bacterium]
MNKKGNPPGGRAKIVKKPFLIAAGIILAVFSWAMWAWGSAGGEYRWYQDYTPAGDSLALSALLAALPIVVMFVMLGGLKKPSHVSAISALAATFLLATMVWKMPPGLAASSTAFGMMMAVFPIMWTLTSAVWIFNMLVDSGYFEVVKKSLGYVTADRRMQTILIGFGFTTLLESMAAFGAPIAIISAMLVGFGFPPMTAGVIALLGDTTPSAWGTQSMPLVVLNSVTGLDIGELAALVGRQTPVASALSPAVLVLVLSGWKGLKGVWPVAAAVGLAYAVMAVIAVSILSPYIVGIAAALAAIITTLAILRFWSPAETWLLSGDCPAGDDKCEPRLPLKTIARAWSPYFLLVLVIGLVNSTGLKHWLAAISTVKIPWPGLHNVVWKTAPVVSQPEAYPAVYSQPLLLVGGTLVFFAGLLTVIALGIKPSRAFAIYVNTLKQAAKPGITIVSILGIAYLMNYSAMTYSIGLAFASAGFWFPMATVFLGMLGCTLAGSVAASNALFGNLSVVAGQQLGIDPVLSAGTLASGGTMGKSIAPQDLVIASATLNLHGQEGELLRRVFWASVFLAGVMGVVAMLQQKLFV